MLGQHRGISATLRGAAAAPNFYVCMRTNVPTHDLARALGVTELKFESKTRSKLALSRGGGGGG